MSFGLKSTPSIQIFSFREKCANGVEWLNTLCVFFAFNAAVNKIYYRTIKVTHDHVMVSGSF